MVMIHEIIVKFNQKKLLFELIGDEQVSVALVLALQDTIEDKSKINLRPYSKPASEIYSTIDRHSLIDVLKDVSVPSHLETFRVIHHLIQYLSK